MTTKLKWLYDKDNDNYYGFMVNEEGFKIKKIDGSYLLYIMQSDNRAYLGTYETLPIAQKHAQTIHDIMDEGGYYEQW